MDRRIRAATPPRINRDVARIDDRRFRLAARLKLIIARHKVLKREMEKQRKLRANWGNAWGKAWTQPATKKWKLGYWNRLLKEIAK